VAAVDAAVAAADAEARSAGRQPSALVRLARAGDAYVAEALADPGVFSVTFRPERCDVTDPTYQEAGLRSFGQLVGLVADAQAEGWNAGLPADRVAAVVWAQVHGTAELLIHGALPAVLGPGGVDEMRAVADSLILGLPPAPTDTPTTDDHQEGP
jgi:hypothetical protein